MGNVITYLIENIFIAMDNLLNVQTTEPKIYQDDEKGDTKSVNLVTNGEMDYLDADGSLSCEEVLDVYDPIRNCAYFEYQQYAYTNITTDAVGGGETSTDSVSIEEYDPVINFDHVTVDKIFAIEDILDVEEKISLIYLLYETVTDARDQVKHLLLESQTCKPSCKPVYEWAMEKKESDTQWRRSLVEALCIIQDYRILRTQFGYQKISLNGFYLPSNKSVAVSVNKTRKMLYLIFDNLPSARVRELFKEIKNDPFFRKKPFKTPQLDGNFHFELYLLDLEYLGYISKDDLKNLARIFKQMQLYAIEEELKGLGKKEMAKTGFNADLNFEKEKKLFVDVEKKNPMGKVQFEQDNINEASLTQEQQSLPLPSIPSGNYYAMNELTPGIALIISNEYFFTEHEEEYRDLLSNTDTSLHNREGTEIDVKTLKSTFRHLNFSEESIIVKKNRKHFEILQEVRDAANKVTEDHSSLFVTILTHGEKENLYIANSCNVEIREIQKIMATTNVALLEGKPKILILHCCQGRTCQTLEASDDDDDYETDSPDLATKSCLPKSVDHFTFLATVPGYAAIRHKARGTRFIQTLCKVLQEISDSRNFEEICTEVVHRVSQKRWKQEGQSIYMVPLKWSTLRMALYLPPFFRKKNVNVYVKVY